MKLKDSPLLKMISVISAVSATGHDLCPIGLMCCEVTIAKSQFRHTFITFRKLQNECLSCLDMQQLH